MRLRTLSLENYRRFGRVRLEFPEGLIAIVGPNGSGKSTLLEAVAWCLYGHEAARTEKDLLKRTGAAPGEDVVVAVEFDLDGAAHRVVRRIRGRSQQSDAQVEVDGTLVVAPGANSADATTQYVARRLGVDRRGFLATVVAQQGDLGLLAEAKAGDRKRLVLGLLGIERVDAAIADARSEKREVSIRLEEVRRSLAREADVRTRLAATRQSLQENGTLVATARGTAQELRRRHANARRALEGAAAAHHRDRELRSRLEALQRALQIREENRVRLGGETQRLEQRRRDHEALRTQGGGFEGLDERIAAATRARERRHRRVALLQEAQALRGDVARWQTVVKPNGTGHEHAAALRLEHDHVEQLLTRAADGRAQAEAHLHHLEEERRRRTAEGAQAGDRWRQLADQGADAPCPTCERPLGEALARLVERHRTEAETRRTDLDAAAAAVGAAREEAMRLQAEGEALRDRRAELERRLETHARREERTRVGHQEIGRAQQRLSAVAAELEHLPEEPEAPDPSALEAERRRRDAWRQDLARLETEVARLASVRAELATLADQVASTRQEIESASRELAALAYEPGSWERLRDDEESARTVLAQTERELAVLEERSALLGAQESQVQREAEELAAVRTNADTLERRLRLAELLASDRGDSGILPEFRTHLISRVRPALAQAATDLVREMTQGRYREIVLDEDYDVRIYDGATAWPLARFSGGERDVVHLALRLAISELVARSRRAQRLQFVALDEVLASQDEDRRRHVVSSLRTLGHHFRQVLLVTHLEEVRERVDHVVEVRLGPDGTSSVRASWTDKV